MTHTILQYLIYLIILVILAIPLGSYIGKVMNREKVFLSKLLSPCEKFIYKIMKIKDNEEANDVITKLFSVDEFLARLRFTLFTC